MQKISPQQFKDALDTADGSVAFIDVRRPDEYAEEHIDGVTNIPLDELDNHIAELAKKDRVYIHCKGGGRGDKACVLLTQYHLSNVFNLDGGIEEWKDNGYPISHS